MYLGVGVTYLLLSLVILYFSIILYIDGDYLYRKVKNFAINRCEYIFCFKNNFYADVSLTAKLNYY